VGTGQNSGTVFWIEPSLCWEHFQISALGLPPSVTSADATCKIDGKPGALHLLATYGNRTSISVPRLLSALELGTVQLWLLSNICIVV